MMDATSIALPYRITASPKKAVLVLLACSAFVALGIFLLTTTSEKDETFYAAWACILFFGLGIPVAIAMLVTRLPALVLSEEGFTIESWFGRKHAVAWNTVLGFHVWAFKGNKWVGYRVVEHGDSLTNAQRVSRQLTGFDGAIDPGTFKAEDLADLMNTLHSHFVSSR